MRARLGDEVFVLAATASSTCSARTPRCSPHFPGAALAGTAYEPPFDYITDYGPRGHTVLLADFVTTDEGTGLVHTAIAFGEDDFRLGEQYGITLAEPGRPDGPLRRADHRLRGPLRQGGRPGHRRGARGARAAAARRGLRARLSALLALRHAAPLLREGELVRADHRGPRPAAGRQRGDRLAPRAHQARPLRQVAREQRRLGALARPLLGHAAADLAVRCRRLRRALLRRLDRRARASARGEVPEDLHRPYIDEVSCACEREGCDGTMRRVAGGDRRLVRLGRDAVRPVPLPVRERGALRGALPRRLHLRGDRPDPRLVLHAARRVGAALRHARATATSSASG